VRFFFLSLCLALGACVQPTGYHEMDWTGGASAQKITHDTYRIVARGNGVTYSETVKDFALLKAAETTVAAGGTHFLVVGTDDASSVTVGSTPGRVTTNVLASSVTTSYRSPETYAIPKPGQDLMIQVLKVNPGDQAPPGAFSALEVINSVAPRVKS
jgi:hypothetical protein